MSRPSSVALMERIETVPSSDQVFGSISTRPGASSESATYSTDWFCRPSFL